MIGSSLHVGPVSPRAIAGNRPDFISNGSEPGVLA